MCCCKTKKENNYLKLLLLAIVLSILAPVNLAQYAPGDRPFDRITRRHRLNSRRKILFQPQPSSKI